MSTATETKAASEIKEDAELPEGWATAKVADLLQLVNGFAFKPSHWKAHGLPIIRIQNLNNPDASFNYCPDKIPAKFSVSNGDLLFAWSGTPGTSFGAHIWHGKEALLNQHIFRVDFKERLLDKKFLRFAINRNLNEYIDQAHGGVGLAHITKGEFEQSDLQIPPLAEQTRIVAKIEQLFKQVNASRERLAKVPKILKAFRKSVLAAACFGHLTGDWRQRHQSVEPASKLLGWIETTLESRTHNAIAEERADDLPETWRESSLERIFWVATGATPLRKNEAYYRDGTIPWVKTGEVRNCDINRAEEFITPLAVQETNAKVFPVGTILIAMYGEGKTRGQVGRLQIQAATNQACAALINPRLPVEMRDYVYYYCLSQYDRLRQEAFGGNQPNLSLGLIKSWRIRIPPLEEQKEIVRRVEDLFKLADMIEKRVEAATKRANKLTQAILAKAFRGELVLTEAELARQEGRDYEPASVLLERH